MGVVNNGNKQMVGGMTQTVRLGNAPARWAKKFRPEIYEFPHNMRALIEEGCDVDHVRYLVETDSNQPGYNSDW